MKNKFKQSSKKNFFIISNLLLFLIGGFLAGFLTLGISIFFDSILGSFSFWFKNGFFFVLFLVMIEELVRFSLINFLFSQKTQITSMVILKGLFFGLGFSLFELILINFKNAASVGMFLVLIVHSINSIIVIISVVYFKNKKNIFILYFLLAFFLHLIYNLGILQY